MSRKSPNTRERLDLLALDRQGRLVVIENKLDSSERNVTWQAIKYASYCSSLSKENVKKMYQEFLDRQKSGGDAENKLSEFFEQCYADLILNKENTQRIILVATEFRGEVKSAVSWLHNFGVDIQCFCAELYSMGNEKNIEFKSIDVDNHGIGVAQPIPDATGHGPKEFWQGLIRAMNEKSDMCKGIEPGTAYKEQKTMHDSFCSVVGVRLYFHCHRAKGKKRGCAQLYIDRKGRNNGKSENKWVYDQLCKKKKKIEENFGNELVWESLQSGTYRIKAYTTGDVSDTQQWPAMWEDMANNMCKLEKALKGPMEAIKQQLDKL